MRQFSQIASVEFDMYIVDMHCDSLLTVDGEHGLVNPYNFSDKNPQLQFVAQFCPNGGRSPEERRKQLIKYLDVYLYEKERLNLEIVASGRDVFSVVDNGTRAVMLTLEGGGGLFADSKELDTLRGAGLSVLGMAWDDNELASSAWTRDDRGLTEEGRKLLDRCGELGIVIDVSHLSDRAFYETLERSPMPVLATHSNFRDVCNSPRNLTKEMAEMIAKRGGVIGLNLYPSFLNESGEADREDVLRHVDYALNLFGDDHLGFGFDIDGTDGKYPLWINPNESIHEQVIDLLLSNYSSETVEKIAGLNVIEFLKDNLV